MKLTFLGIGSAFNPNLKNNNAFIINKKQLFLLDCGQSSFEILWNMPEFKEINDIYILITHLHSDHVGGLAALISWSKHELGKKLNVIHHNSNIKILLSLMGIVETDYHYFKDIPSSASLSFEFVDVTHVKNMKSYGYIISDGSMNIYYSGDAKNIPDNVLDKFRSGEIEYIYQDTSLEKDVGHAYIGYLENLFNKEERKRVFSMHFEVDSMQYIKNKGFQIPKLYNDN